MAGEERCLSSYRMLENDYVHNMVPMIFIAKPSKDGGPPGINTIADTRERNKDTRKLASPLPDINGMCCRATSHPICTLLDQKGAFEQICVVKEHIDQSAVTTPNRNIISLVIPDWRL